MQYAFVDGVKSEPVKGAKGICIGCGNQMSAKCGMVNMHHWAHRANVACDSWWEKETEWHREWKSRFAAAEREITFYDEAGEEFHRADVHTAAGITIEFQNSPLSLTELLSREAFYPKLVWVVNGLKFKGFAVTEAIPNPADQQLIDYDFAGTAHLTFISTRDAAKGAAGIFSRRHPLFSHVKTSDKHFTFAWKYAHSGWLSAKSPLFIDLGGHFMYWLRLKKQVSGDFHYLQLVSKQAFLKKYGSVDLSSL